MSQSVWSRWELLFLLAVVARGARTLIREPFVTLSILQDAAVGYLNLGSPLP
jgi:hypothetical protein